MRVVNMLNAKSNLSKLVDAVESGAEREIVGSKLGLPGYSFDTGWHAMFAPPKTPAAIVNRLHAEVRKAFESGPLREAFSSTGYEPAAAAPADFTKLFKADLKRFAAIMKAAKIEAQ